MSDDYESPYAFQAPSSRQPPMPPPTPMKRKKATTTASMTPPTLKLTRKVAKGGAGGAGGAGSGGGVGVAGGAVVVGKPRSRRRAAQAARGPPDVLAGLSEGALLPASGVRSDPECAARRHRPAPSHSTTKTPTPKKQAHPVKRKTVLARSLMNRHHTVEITLPMLGTEAQLLNKASKAISEKGVPIRDVGLVDGKLMFTPWSVEDRLAELKPHMARERRLTQANTKKSDEHAQKLLELEAKEQQLRKLLETGKKY